VTSIPVGDTHGGQCTKREGAPKEQDAAVSESHQHSIAPTEKMAKRKTEKDKSKKAKKKRRRSQDTSLEEKSKAEHKASLFKKKFAMTVSLLPASLSNIGEGIQESLEDSLLQYSEGFDGILMAFDNIKVLGHGSMLNELPYIHFDITVEALVFRPAEGCDLVGKVTETFPSHVSLLVYNFFNASISAEELRKSGFALDGDQWTIGDEKTLSVNDEVHFICDEFFESSGIVSITGRAPQQKQINSS